MTDTTTLESQLDAWLSGGTEEIYGPPEDQEKADRLLHALRGVRNRKEQVDDLVKERIDAVRVWGSQQWDQLSAREAELERLLEGWARAQHADTGRKTWKLPAGELRVRPLVPRTDLVPGTDVAKLGADVQAMTGPGMLPSAAVKTEVKAQLGVIKANTSPGELVADFPTPEGYEARQAVASFDFGGPELQHRVIPGVVLLVPLDGPAGQRFSAVTP